MIEIINLCGKCGPVREVEFGVKKSANPDRQREQTRARVTKFRQKHKVRLAATRQKAAWMRLSGTIGRPPVHRCYELFFAEGPLTGIGADVLIVRDGDPLIIPPGLYHERRWLISIAVSLREARSMRKLWLLSFRYEAPPDRTKPPFAREPILAPE